MVPVPTAVLWAMEFGEEGNEPVGWSKRDKPTTGKCRLVSQFD